MPGFWQAKKEWMSHSGSIQGQVRQSLEQLGIWKVSLPMTGGWNNIILKVPYKRSHSLANKAILLMNKQSFF